MRTEKLKFPATAHVVKTCEDCPLEYDMSCRYYDQYDWEVDTNTIYDKGKPPNCKVGMVIVLPSNIAADEEPKGEQP
jgi:hypothetical protein